MPVCYDVKLPRQRDGSSWMYLVGMSVLHGCMSVFNGCVLVIITDVRVPRQRAGSSWMYLVGGPKAMCVCQCVYRVCVMSMVVNYLDRGLGPVGCILWVARKPCVYVSVCIEYV